MFFKRIYVLVTNKLKISQLKIYVLMKNKLKSASLSIQFTVCGSPAALIFTSASLKISNRSIQNLFQGP